MEGKKYILFDSSDNFNITVEEHVKILKKMEKAESDEESLRDDDSELSFFTADFWVEIYVEKALYFKTLRLLKYQKVLNNIHINRIVKKKGKRCICF